MATLVDDLVPDQLWAIVEPLLPPHPRPPYGGRHRAIPDRNCFAAIIYMARTSTPWRLLPARELGCGSPATAWRRLDEWARAGVFDQLHLDVLDRLGEQGRLDWTRASVDSGERARQTRGTTWAQIPSIAASADPNCTWSATDRGCPLPRRSPPQASPM
jgi:transposase